MNRRDEAGTVAGIILASGMSRRFGAANKLLTRIEGEPMVRRTAAAYVSAGLRPTVAVVGYEADAVAGALAGLAVRIVHNPDYRMGQSRALVRGVEAISGAAEAAVIGVADQPWLSASTVLLLVRRWHSTGAPIVAPRYRGRRGNPVLFSSTLFPELLAVTGDVGGKPVLERHLAQVAWTEVLDALQGRDVDTPGTAEAARD
jgi:molybdenum cofactor cytidylyltransferase